MGINAHTSKPHPAGLHSITKLLPLTSKFPRRNDDRRGGESYRPGGRQAAYPPYRGYTRHHRSPPPFRSSRPTGDAYMASTNHVSNRRSRSPPHHRSRSPSFRLEDAPYGRRRSPPRRFSPPVATRADDKRRSPRADSPTRAHTPSRRPWEPSLGQDHSRFHKWEPPASPAGGHGRTGPRREASSRPQRNESGFDRSTPKGAPWRADGITRSGVREGWQSTPHNRELPAPAKAEIIPTGPAGAWGSTANVAREEKECPSDSLGWAEAQRPYFAHSTVSHDNSPNQETVDRNVSTGHFPPSGPSHGLKPSQNSGNISLSSAPTRPRRFGDSQSPVKPTPIRHVPTEPAVPATTSPSAVPKSHADVTPSGGSEASRPHRQSSSGAHHHSRGPRVTGYLGNLSTIIPGGKLLSFGLDPAGKKRIAQLESDREKLMSQIDENQRSRRHWMKIWDHGDRECSVSILRGELADGHLRQMEMAEGNIRADALF